MFNVLVKDIIAVKHLSRVGGIDQQASDGGDCKHWRIAAIGCHAAAMSG